MSSKKILLSRPIHYLFYIVQRDGKFGEEFKAGGGGRTHLIFIRGGEGYLPLPCNRLFTNSRSLYLRVRRMLRNRVQSVPSKFNFINTLIPRTIYLPSLQHFFKNSLSVSLTVSILAVFAIR